MFTNFYHKNKYNNKKIILDDIIFDSQKEAKRYAVLKILLRGGEIEDLKLQPEFILQESFVKNGKKFRPITYKADFQYYSVKENKIVVEDVKGIETEVFKIKRKLFEHKFPDFELTLI